MDRKIGVGRALPSIIRRMVAGGGKRSLHSRLRWAGFFFVLPALIHLVIFKFYPMLQAFRLSFYRYDLMSPPVFTGLKNYNLLWENPLFHQSFWVSVKYMFGVSIPEWFFALALGPPTEPADAGAVRSSVWRTSSQSRCRKSWWPWCGSSCTTPTAW